MNIKQAHAKLGHSNEVTTRKTAKALDINISKGPLPPCVACTIGKAKQKNVPKMMPGPREIVPGHTVHLDIATIKPRPGESALYKPNMYVIINAVMMLILYEALQHKNDMIESTCEHFHNWRKNGIPIKFV